MMVISPFSLPSQCRLRAPSIRAKLSSRVTSGHALWLSSNVRCNRALIGRQERCDPPRRASSATTVASASSTSTSSYSSSSKVLSSLITPSTIVIVGAGIAGVATARALSLVGIDDFIVLEKSSKPRAEGTSIWLCTNAWRALDALRVGDELRGSWPQLHDVQLYDSSGKKLREIAIDDCAGGPHEARGVGRAALVRSLASKVPEAKMAFGCNVLSVRDVSSEQSSAGGGGSGSGSVELEVEGLVEPLRCRVLVAADGPRSTLVQKAITDPSSSSSSAKSSALLKPLRYVGYTAYRGIASFPEDAVPPMLPRDRYRIHFGSGVRAGIVPLGVHLGGVSGMSGEEASSSSCSSSDDSSGNKEPRALFYWFTCQNEPQGDKTRISDVALMRADAARALSTWNLPATGIDALQNASADSAWSRAAISDRWLEEGKSYGVGTITAVGDAAHPMTPNAGQGGCVGLEDAVELARALKKGEKGSNSGLSEALREFEAKRATRARWVQVKSFAIGFGGQLDLPFFPVLRDFLLSSVYPIEEFLDLARYDCGGL